MKSISITACLLGAALAVPTADKAAFSPEMYESGEVMQQIMEAKERDWADLEAKGQFRSENYPAIKEKVTCEDGVAVAVEDDPMQTFRCNNIDLYSFRPHSELGSKAGRGSSSWGWTAPDGREFVAVGQMDGAAFAEITKDGQLQFLGRLPAYSVNSIWREIRGFKNYMVIGSEATNHGIQVFDMRKLLTVDPKKPVTYDNKKDLTGWFGGLPVGSTHNVVVNEEANHIYSVGAVPRNHTYQAGIIAIDMTDVSKPVMSGYAADAGYVHDAQCLIYRGPDTKYVGKDICYGYNERNLVIYDMSNKSAPKIISKTGYDGVAYCHQGWVLDRNNQAWMIMDDEYDEVTGKGPAPAKHPTTYIWNITSLEAPKNTGFFKGTVASVDHNQYIYNGLSYQSNYGSGLRVVDVRSIPTDPTGKSVREIGFFDIYPNDDNQPDGGVAQFAGSWSSYSNFPSGYIFVNTIERGGFVVKIRDMPE